MRDDNVHTYTRAVLQVLGDIAPSPRSPPIPRPGWTRCTCAPKRLMHACM